MIHIELKAEKNRYEIRAKGHALFNPGNDIVCSAVSCLFYTFVGFLGNCKDIWHSFELKSGNAEIKAEGDIGQAYKMFMIGLLQIEKSYPDNVKVAVY